MSDLESEATEEFTKLIGSPFLILEEICGSEEFYVVEEYAPTLDCAVAFKKGNLLFLHEDLVEVRNPGKFRLNFMFEEYPHSLVNALRDYAAFKRKKYVSIDYSAQSWHFKDNTIIEVSPRLFIPTHESCDEPYLPLRDGIGVGPTLSLV